MRVYLDNNATTKMDNEVFEAMVPYLTEYYGNASSLHLFGKETNKAMNESRETIAKHLGVEPNEIIFTASGSESDNLAIRGIARAYKNRGKHIIASPIEHPAIKNTLKDLEDEGYEITILHVDKNGVLNIEELKNAIKDETILITVMHANNEVGTFQPIEEIGKIAKENKIIFHVDAVQTMGKVDIKPKEMGIDLLSFSAHKFYGPKGIAALYWRNGVRFGKVLTGGGQEGKRRPGTSNVPGMVGMAKALEIAYRDMAEEFKKEEELRDYFESEVLKRIPEVVINAKEAKRLPGTSSITFKYLEGESILLSLSYKGIAVSSGSACSSDDLQASHVLLAMGIEPEFAHGTIRFGLGKYNTKEEIDYTLDVLVEVIEKLRAISPLWNEFKNK
ncbi:MULTISPECIES: cysteine desulfurase NifS [Fusobacterium]|jgi:cysteine desulfurase|uniref:Cysteine desulfurase n=1 Tax=Fusobacterium varium ATCC 27725 TaxID=469618 RepID=A0ABM6U3B1_FUSVA|nr:MULTISPECIES: cysteine desulfurase NifS [Fusobacterium]AVQ30794.1 cysteine desulfurase NifS [Fusobacterium varium ATCC 27725]EES64220.1 cysteine desulfurase NifS [Fusobacterium varium ATCC 27725]MCD7979110.1 cysteine desulfurase NifS [Fusobacterium sp.]MCI6033597.1 cysteine desulfurase NifS [Fusobacterium varium]MDY4006613.1 cysteine desulfurase NifS [Fusobacterium varium]